MSYHLRDFTYLVDAIYLLIMVFFLLFFLTNIFGLNMEHDQDQNKKVEMNLYKLILYASSFQEEDG